MNPRNHPSSASTGALVSLPQRFVLTPEERASRAALEKSEAERRLQEAEKQLRMAIEELYEKNRSKSKLHTILRSARHPLCSHGDSCVANAVGSLLQSFLLAYGVRVGIGVILHAFKLMKSRPWLSVLDMKLLLSERNLIVREEACRIGLLFGGFTGLYHAVRCGCRRVHNKDAPGHSFLAGALAGLSILSLDDPSKRRSFALYLLVRLGQCAYTSASQSSFFTSSTSTSGAATTSAPAAPPLPPHPTTHPLEALTPPEEEKQPLFRSLLPSPIHTLLSSPYLHSFLSSYGSAILFSLSCAHIMYAFVMRPDTLPPAYRHFLLSVCPIDRRVLQAMGRTCRGQPVDIPTLSSFVTSAASASAAAGPHLGRQTTSQPLPKLSPLLSRAPHALSSPSTRSAVPSSANNLVLAGLFSLFGRKPSASSPWPPPLLLGPLPPSIPCSALHPHTPSCSSNTLSVFKSVFRRTFPMHLSLTLVPFAVLNLQRFLQSPLRTAWLASRSALRSTTFLASFAGTYMALVCSQRNLFVSDTKSFYWLAGLLAGFTVLIEKSSRRAELALYTLPRAADSLWCILNQRNVLPNLKFAEVLLFSLSTGGLMFYYDQEPSTLAPFLRSIISRFLSRTKLRPIGTADSQPTTPSSSSATPAPPHSALATLSPPPPLASPSLPAPPPQVKPSGAVTNGAETFQERKGHGRARGRRDVCIKEEVQAQERHIGGREEGWSREGGEEVEEEEQWKEIDGGVAKSR